MICGLPSRLHFSTATHARKQRSTQLHSYWPARRTISRAVDVAAIRVRARCQSTQTHKVKARSAFVLYT